MRNRSVPRTLALGAVAVGIAAPLVRHRLRLPARAVSVLAWQAPLALVLAVPRTRARDAGIYALQMWAYIVHYELPADDAETLRRRLRIRYPIRADEALGLGEIPTIRLQRRFGRPGEVTRLDGAMAMVHWSWFAFPHGSVLYLLLRHRDQFPRGVTELAAVFDIGLAGYWLVPTAPPWWAGANRYTRPVRRIMVEAGERILGRAWPPLYAFFGGNPFAAMPSLHFATSVMAARVLSRLGPGHALVGWGYAGTLGFALVYLGEHYVIDLLVGFALAEAVRVASPHAAPAVTALAHAIQRLEPRAA